MKRRYIIAATLIVVAITLILVFIVGSKQGGATIVVESAPNILRLTLNERRVTNSGVINLPPGTHTLHASMDGFESRTIEFTIAEGEEKTFEIYLQPNSEQGFAYLEQNPEQAMLIESLVGKELTRGSEAATQNYPIITDLPITDQAFRIDYGPSREHPETEGAIAIYIRAIDQEGRDDALNWMRTFGHNPDEYELIYINPLEEN